MSDMRQLKQDFREHRNAAHQELFKASGNIYIELEGVLNSVDLKSLQCNVLLTESQYKVDCLIDIHPSLMATSYGILINGMNVLVKCKQDFSDASLIAVINDNAVTIDSSDSTKVNRYIQTKHLLNPMS